MSTRLQPWYNCNNNLLTVMWPTDDVFPVDTKVIPDTYKTTNIKLLNTSPPFIPEIVILTHSPP